MGGTKGVGAREGEQKLNCVPCSQTAENSE